MTILLLDRFGPFILSSEEGRELATEIGAALDRGECVELDFAGVRSVVSAFLNPAVGDLYGRFSSETVDTLIVCTHASDVQIATFDAVRDQARRFYNDADYRRKHDAAVAELFP